MKDIALNIIKHFGLEHQLRKLNEEYYELQEAITIHELKKTVEYEIPLTEIIGTKEHIIEELGDVRLVLLQIQSFYGITDEEIENAMEFKGVRTLERIKNNDGRN